jgi:MtrB/PioB family decaheme-associated outer membrane protein
MNSKYSTILNVMVPVLLALPVSLWAQQTEETYDIQKDISIGIYYLDDDSYRYGKYSGLTDDGAYALFDFKLEKLPDPKSDDTTRWRLQGWRLGLDSRRVELDFNQQGTQRFKVDYREIPNYRFSDGLTPFRKQSPGVWNLASGWQVAPGSSNTRGFANLAESLVDLSVDTTRRRMDLSYGRKLGSRWNLDIDFRHETKTGERTLGSIFGYTGGNPRGMILPAPVDYTTDTLEAMFGYSNGRAQVNFGVYVSIFGNEKTTLTFQNPFGHQSQWADGVEYPDSMGRMALEPDNSFVQFRANAGMYIGDSTRLTGDFAFGKMKQDDKLLPYTVNPDLHVHTPVPLERLDAKIDVTMFNLRLTSQLARRLGLAVNYHYDDRDNKTAREVYPYIGGDAQDQREWGDGRINRPYSYTRHRADALATYRFSGGIRLKAGIDYSDYKRDFQEVEDSDEFAYLAGLSFRGWSMASLRLDYRNSSRDISEYNGNASLFASHVPGHVEEDDWENHPLLRKYFLTDRDRDEFRLRADVFPNPQVNFGFAASYFKDDYDDDFFGLNEAKVRNWSVDAGWYPRENLAVTGFYTREDYDSSQSSRSFNPRGGADNPDNNWWVDSDDAVDTYNIALSLSDIGADKGWNGVEFGMDYTYSNTVSKIDVMAATASTEPMPDLVAKMQTFSIWGSFAVGERSNIRLSAESSKLKTADWGFDLVVPDSLANVLLLGESAANYDLWLVSAAWSYRF